MKLAIKEAYSAKLMGEVPVGAVIVKNDNVIALAHNKKESLKDPTAHSEILVIREAARRLSDWLLTDCDLYVTLEPCAMCASAISQARIRRLYFGSYDKDAGAAGSKYSIVDAKCEIYGGICEDECNKLIGTFFKEISNK